MAPVQSAPGFFISSLLKNNNMTIDKLILLLCCALFTCAVVSEICMTYWFIKSKRKRFNRIVTALLFYCIALLITLSIYVYRNGK